jgi:transcription elongation factor GreA
MSRIQYYTEEGLNKLRDRLNELRIKGRAEVAREIAEARDKGDLSENAEYDAAKDKQGLLELEISKLDDLVANARLIDESKIDASQVSILSKVKLKNKKNNAEVLYILVAEKEANLKEHKISIDSLIGKGLLGKKVGDAATIQVPAGVMEFEVLEITR